MATTTNKIQLTHDILTSSSGGVLTIPSVAAPTIVSVDSSSTLTNKTLSGAILTSPNITNKSSSIDLGAAATFELTSDQARSSTLLFTNANGGGTIVYLNAANVPTGDGKNYTIVNGAGAALDIAKEVGGGGISVANTKTAVVSFDVTADQFVRVTLDA